MTRDLQKAVTSCGAPITDHQIPFRGCSSKTQRPSVRGFNELYVRDFFVVVLFLVRGNTPRHRNNETPPITAQNASLFLKFCRFDRVVRVDVPDVDGREEILKVHTRKMKVDQTADLRAVAEITPGES